MRRRYSNSRIVALINEYIHNKRDREILKDFFVDGTSYEEIAEKHSLSTRRVAAIIRHGRETVFPLINSDS